VHYVWFLTKAGIETPAATMTAIFHYLAEHPEIKQALIADRASIPKAVEELLRLVGPVHTGQRSVAKDAVLHGHNMTAGEPVMLLWESANRDPRQFDEPDACLLGRSKNKHLAFGAGRHRCIGLHLARLELQVAIEEMFDHLPDFRVKEDAELRWNVGGVQRTLTSLPIVF
jgi:cytochrome P450